MRFGRNPLPGLLAVSSFLFCRRPRSRRKLPTSKIRRSKIIRGGEPGGTGDLQARALIPFLKKHIPGDPTIVVENMPGAAGRKAANHIFSTAKPDGLSIGAVGAGPGRRTDPWAFRFAVRPRQADLSRLHRERRSLCVRQPQRVGFGQLGKTSRRQPDCASARKQSVIRSTSAAACSPTCLD